MIGVITAALLAVTPAPSGLPLTPTRTLHIDAHRGTWMSLDVAPDGRTIVFDMLGDLYSLPVTGGDARQLTRGLAFDTSPVFSPDGRWIAYVSDSTGTDNLWLVHPDGSDAHPITNATGEAVLVSPAWAADGQSLFVSRYYADRNNYELVRIPLNGPEAIIFPIRSTPSQPRGEWRSSLGASVSRDGAFLFYARHTGGLNFDALDAWEIVQRDLASGRESVVIGGPVERGRPSATVFCPQIAPDGRTLAYATRRANVTELRTRDLSTGVDRRVAIADPDEIEASAWQNLLPRYAFTPDGKSLILAHDGGFERVDLASGTATVLPFHAAMAVDVGPSTRTSIREERGPVRARLVQAPIASPDGRTIAFSALGRLFVQPRRPGSRPHPLSTGDEPAFQPSWSPDGRRLVYVTWSERNGGAIGSIAADGSDRPRAIVDAPAFYTNPVFTPDGARIVAVRSPMAARLESTFEYGKLRQADLVVLPAAGGEARVVMSGLIGSRPQFTHAPGKVFVPTGEGLKAIDLTTGAASSVAHVTGPGYYFTEGPAPVDDVRISPDGGALLVQLAEQLWLLPTPVSGAADLDDPASGARRLTRVGADFFEWERDGSIDWSVGSTFRHLPNAALALTHAEQRAEGVAMTVSVPRAIAHGHLLLRGARVLTMAHGDRVISDADILIADDRIAAIGPRGSFPVPAGTTIRDVTGKTILPGFIDEHDHIAEVRREVLGLEDWGLRARLAYGVTTSFDPSTLSIDMLAYQDLLDSGAMVGPRLRSTGPALFSFNRFASLGEVRDVLRRYRDNYGLRNIKEYRTGNRRVRQWVAIAARELGLQPTTEGALALKLDLSQILDGFAGNEHALSAGLLGDDVLALMAAQRTSYATTMMTTHTGPPGVDWFAITERAADDPHIARFWPPAAIEEKLAHRDVSRLGDYRFDLVGRGAADLAAAGGLVGMGAHGEAPGIGFHWEMWAHALGGMAPMAVLHAATAGSAETIGRLADLGTIEPGKSADLVILDADPIASIRNTVRIGQVMRGGLLYAAETLDRLWPEPLALPAPWFAKGHSVERWSPHEEALSNLAG